MLPLIIAQFLSYSRSIPIANLVGAFRLSYSRLFLIHYYFLVHEFLRYVYAYNLFPWYSALFLVQKTHYSCGLGLVKLIYVAGFRIQANYPERDRPQQLVLFLFYFYILITHVSARGAMMGHPEARWQLVLGSTCILGSTIATQTIERWHVLQ